MKQEKNLKIHSATLTVPTAARRLGFTLKYVYDLIYSGRLDAKKIAGRWCISEQAIAARLKQRGA